MLCVRLDGGLEHGIQAEAEMRQRRERHVGCAEQQQHRLDDLHPGRRDHAAERDVEDHQHADDEHGVAVAEAEQQLDELAGTDHLRDEVERDDDERADGGKRAHRHCGEPVGRHVGQAVAAEIAQPLGHQEHDDRPADQEADRVQQAVEAGRIDHAPKCRGTMRQT